MIFLKKLFDYSRFKIVVFPLVLLTLAYFLFAEENLKTIFVGIAIFIIGMKFMEDGFKLFSGNSLEIFLEKFTNSLPKSMFMGFFATTLVQSSSLISIIIISFLSIKIITLPQAIGVIFGANLGSTTTAWLVSFFGLKLNIASYAMPMIIFGVIATFLKSRTYEALGNVLLGLGFVFLAIFYMKDGFETLQGTIDLSQYAIEGYMGFVIFALVGAVATVVMQSSGATMALIITALALNQITYENAIALTIGVNVGTPFTAVLASLTSNENGKRLALVHLVFNCVTALATFSFLANLTSFIDVISNYFGVLDNNYTIKLSIFHTIFNLAGIIIMTPFISKIEKLSRYIIKDKYKAHYKPKFISKELIDVPVVSIKALENELLHLYKNSQKIILHTISLHRTDVFSNKNLKKTIKKSNDVIVLDNIYNKNMKQLYNEIMTFASASQKYMEKEDEYKVFKLKIAAKEILNGVREVKKLEKNILTYLNSKNQFIKLEYNILRMELANSLKEIDLLDNEKYSEEKKSSKISKINKRLNTLDIITNGRIDTLIRKNKINAKMASSLISDSSTTYHICKKLLLITNILFMKDEKLEIIEDNS
jgi:phosphate:Na+ symporter